jgi:hypothetical protein
MYAKEKKGGLPGKTNNTIIWYAISRKPSCDNLKWKFEGQYIN